MIKPLCKDNYNEASKLANSIFPKDDPSPYICFLASIDEEKRKSYNDKYKTIEMMFFVYMLNKKVCGTVGLYTVTDDYETCDWLGYFCVSENLRRSGIGSELLQYIIDLSKKRRKDKLKLYTGFGDTEAHRLYEKFRFIKTGTMIDHSDVENHVYELKLK